MSNAIGILLIVSTMCALSACNKQVTSKSTPLLATCDGPETMNGYKDDDNCADELARLLISVTDANLQPLNGIHVLLPGMSVPAVTSSNGTVMLFELLPVPAIQLELINPMNDSRLKLNATLKEGENTLTIPTEWSSPTAPK